MSGLTVLPADILLRIIFFLPAIDIIRLRQVSKTFYSLTRLPSVWIDAYKNAALPRPPGPYASATETWESLECTLVFSERVEPWSGDRPARVAARHTFRSPGVDNWQFLWGSWFITTIGPELVCYDLDQDHLQKQVLFRLNDDDARFFRFACDTTVTLDGHPVAYVLLGGLRNAGDPLLLLKIIGHPHRLSLDSTMSLSFSGHEDIITINASPRYICLRGTYRTTTLVLLDVTTEELYHLPPLRSAVAPQRIDHLMNGGTGTGFMRFFLTDTHILLSLSAPPQRDLASDPQYLIQAFALPSEDISGASYDDGMLRMTHEGMCEIFSAPNWVLRGAMAVDHSGVKSTRIRLMNLRRVEGEADFNVIDLTLSPASPDPSDGAGTIELTGFTRLFSFEGHAEFTDMASSQDGFGRGICYVSDTSANCYIYAFSVDASGAICRGSVGPRREVDTIDNGLYFFETLEFFAWNGRACFVKDDEDGNNEIRVVEFVAA